MSTHFSQVTVLIDGLDECGSALDRTNLVDVLASLNNSTAGSIRIAIASRKERDIEERLTQFTSLPVAANNFDLELYVATEVTYRASRLPILNTNTNLREEVIKALVGGAEGMYVALLLKPETVKVNQKLTLLTPRRFQWVKCQLDYLCKLPNEFEIRRALKELPPDLPATYIRLLERIDNEFDAFPARIYIQRALKWLALGKIKSLEALAQAVSVDPENSTLESEKVPDPLSICDWCSSLVQVDYQTKTIELSHKTVKEFLLTQEDSVPSLIARKYLVNQVQDNLYLANVCIAYLGLDTFQRFDGRSYYQGPFYNKDAANNFDKEFPFYRNASQDFRSHILASNEIECLDSLPFQRFFTVEISAQFLLWDQHCNRIAVEQNSTAAYRGDPIHLTPFQVSCSLLLHATVDRMIKEGVELNPSILPELSVTELSDDELPATGIHLAISYKEEGNEYDYATWWLRGEAIPGMTTKQDQSILQMVQYLVRAGLDINAESDLGSSSDSLAAIIKMTPLALAVICGLADVCKFLLKEGARFGFGLEKNWGEHLYDVFNRSLKSKGMSEVWDSLEELPDKDTNLRLLLDRRNHLEVSSLPTSPPAEQVDFDGQLDGVEWEDSGTSKRLLGEGAIEENEPRAKRRYREAEQ